MFKPLKQAASLIVCIFKSWKVLDFCFFVGEVITGVGLGIGPWIPTARANFLTEVFSGN